jgi:hypothetical protein
VRTDGDYSGKMIHMVISVAAGRGYDIYGRMVAEHIWRHIPKHHRAESRKSRRR